MTIDGEPLYRCDPDGRRFADGDAFVAHLRTAHRTPPERIRELLVVRDGHVQLIGE